MKSLVYTSALLALLAASGVSYAQDATQPQATTPADCPAPGSVPEAQIPANCKVNAQQTTQPSANQNADQNANQNATGGNAAAVTGQPMKDINPQTSFLASNFIGQTVYSAANENIGEINDLIFDKERNVVVAVVGVGGFLGIGEKNVAMSLDQINAAKSDNNTIRLNVNATREQLEAAPAFDRNMLAGNAGMMPGATTGTTTNPDGTTTTAPATGTGTTQ